MATPIGILQRTLNDLRGLIWHYEEGLKSRIIALHKDAHPNEEKSNGNILHEELNKCRRFNAHNQINTHLTNMDAGITHLSDFVQQLQDRLAGKRQEYSTLCEKIHVQKAIIKDCNATITAMTEEDQRKAESIASLQAALADKNMKLATLENDQQGGRVVQVTGEADGGDKDPQSSADAKNTALILMEQVKKLEEELEVKEIEVEALRTADSVRPNAPDDDKMARWEQMTEKIINDLLKMEQEYSLSRSLAMQNEELRDTVLARELTIADLTKEVVALKTLGYQPQEQSPLDLYRGFDDEASIKSQANTLEAGQPFESHVTHLRRMEVSPSASMIFAHITGSTTEGPIEFPRSDDDDETEDIFEDCVAEQEETRCADVEEAGTDPSKFWPGFSTSDTRDITEILSKSVWEDLSGLDLLCDEEH